MLNEFDLIEQEKREKFEEGMEQGMEQGVEKGFVKGKTSTLNECYQVGRRLSELGRSEELLKAISDQNYMNKLKIEFGI